VTITHTAKIVVRVLTKIERQVEDVLGEDQFGFRRRKGTGDAVALLRIISVQMLGIDEKLCACFTDWQKAFDRGKWTKLMRILKGTGIDWHKRRSASCTWISVKLKLDQEETRSLRIGREVRQGCSSSPVFSTSTANTLTGKLLKGLETLK